MQCAAINRRECVWNQGIAIVALAWSLLAGM